jgi:hypothetical protein
MPHDGSRLDSSTESVRRRHQLHARRVAAAVGRARHGRRLKILVVLIVVAGLLLHTGALSALLLQLLLPPQLGPALAMVEGSWQHAGNLPPGSPPVGLPPSPIPCNAKVEPESRDWRPLRWLFLQTKEDEAERMDPFFSVLVSGAKQSSWVGESVHWGPVR